MVIQGTVINGVIVPDAAQALPEGAKVQIYVAAVAPSSDAEAETSLYDRLKPLIGSLQGLPSDFAAEHDHYIHGTPKRS